MGIGMGCFFVILLRFVRHYPRRTKVINRATIVLLTITIQPINSEFLPSGQKERSTHQSSAIADLSTFPNLSKITKNFPQPGFAPIICRTFPILAQQNLPRTLRETRLRKVPES